MSEDRARSDLIDRAATAEAVEKLALYDGDPRWARSQADIAESMRKRAVALIDAAPRAATEPLNAQTINRVLWNLHLIPDLAANDIGAQFIEELARQQGAAPRAASARRIVECPHCGEQLSVAAPRAATEPERKEEKAAIEAGTHEPAVDDFGNQYLARKKVQGRSKDYCGDCDGVGWVEGGPTIQTICDTCGGSGWAR